MTAVKSVPLLDPCRANAPIEAELRAAFDRVLASGRYILGPEVEALEKECAAAIGVKHAVGVSSGTDALILALMALGIGPGDEVILPSYTFFASAGAVWRVGAVPVFADVMPCCYNIDPRDLVKKITPRTKALMPVHLFGQCAQMAPIRTVAQQHGIPIVEDAAQAFGARCGEKSYAGSMGAYGCFSFFPSKNLGGFGDAGLVTTNDDDLADRAQLLRTHGGRPKYHHSVVGGNFRIDPLQAALIRVKLGRLPDYTARRQRNADHYTRRLQEAGIAAVAPSVCLGEDHRCETRLTLPAACRDHHIYNQYIVRAADQASRDRIRSVLGDRKIGTEIYYPIPLHEQACFASVAGRAGSLPIAEAAARQTLALPIFPELLPEEIEYVVNALTACFG